MSGTFPSSLAPTSITIRSVQPTLVSETHNMKRQVRSRGGQRWGFKLRWNARPRSEMAALMAFVIAQRGRFETFQFVPALMGDRQASGGGTPVVTTTVAAGRSIPTSGWNNNVTVGKAGDFVKFAGHSKVYMLTADAVSDGAGAATLAIEPALYAALAPSEVLTMNAVPLTVSFASDVHEIPVSAPNIFSFECDLIEVLP